jgi:nitroreductase
MDIFDAILTRRSCRKFQHKKIPKELLEKIIQAGLHSPSSKNSQPWHFIIDNTEKKKTISAFFKAEIERHGHEQFSVKIPGTNKNAKPPTAIESARILEECDTAIFIFSTSPFTGGKKQVLTYPDMNSLLAYSSEIESIAAASQNMLLAAHALGLGAVWNCDVYYIADQIQREYGVEYDFCLAICLGYPDSSEIIGQRVRLPNYHFV